MTLKRGEFSNSQRLTALLSTLARFNIDLEHISGSANLSSDFISRNTKECNVVCCQICEFVNEAQDIMINNLAVEDILNNHLKQQEFDRNFIPIFWSVSGLKPSIDRSSRHVTT